ncbi:hypothetical protein INT43_002711 [Umbelopsis isabellina]|uniref:Poly [ADP-ribose] polymerase n=1 Tax=Mortierella isabellina TaxID=91625 RepID=A0A8H7Q5J0_MORIS|nr:hypothetical protein INT43_002711 [Umbelopsis isabellina]
MVSRTTQKTRQLQKSNKAEAHRALSKEKTSTDRKILKKVAKKAVNNVIKNAAKQRQYLIKDEEDMAAPYRIERILDSKQDMNGLMFLVQFTGDGQTSTSWIRERELGSRDLLLQYHQEHPNLEPVGASENLDSNSKSRASKTRAKLLLQHDALFHDDEQPRTTPKRASIKSAKRTADGFGEGAERPGKGSKKKSVKAVKAEQLKEERDNRIKFFEATLPHFSFSISKPHIKNLECCSRCSAREYSRAIANNDKKLLSELCKDEKLVPNWTLDENPNTPFQSPFVDAVLSGKTEFVELMLEADKNPRGPPVKNAESFNTGFVSKTAFGSYARPVKESRGNRRGNQAFYSQADKPPLEVQQARSYTLAHSKNRALLAVMQNPSISATMIDYLYLKCNEANSCLMAWGTYEAIAAGNRAVACNIVSTVGETAGFNNVHMAVLKLNGDQLLPAYRKNQILKKALDVHNLTPLACAAIHPKSTYLAELFEQLDAVGQGFTDSYGRTVAHFAAASETSDCLQYLMSKGFNCMQLDKAQSSPLTLAAKYGRVHNVELLLEMLKSNTNDESAKIADTTMLNQKWTPLHYAAYYGRPEICSTLIKYGASVESQDSRTKSTPLHFAATQGNTECIRVLIEDGKVDVDIVDKYGSTALHMACKNGQYDSVVTLLSFGADANAEDTSGNCPLHHAAAYGWLSIVKLLVEATDCQANPSNLWKTTPCGIANRKGHSKVVRFFLETKAKKFDINFKDNNGRTMLHHCLEENISSEYEANQLTQKVIHLLKCGANPNLQDIEGSTPLHVLAKDSQFVQERPLGYPTHVHKAFVEFGSNGNIEGYPKLDYDDKNGALVQEKIINILIEAGADPEMEDAGGETPIAVAMAEGNNHIVQYLLQHGASPLTTTAAGDNIFHYLLSSFKKTDMTVWKDHDGVIKERIEMRYWQIWGLVTKHASKSSDLKSLVNAINNKGYTPILWGLHVAINTQKEHVKKIINISSFVPRLLSWNQQSAPVQNSDIRYHFERWAHFAAQFIQRFKPNMNTVRELEKDFLVKNPKAKVSDYPKGTGMGLLHLAAGVNKPILIELFLKHGCDANHKAGALDDYKTPIMISAVLKSSNFFVITNKTTEELEKLKSSYNIVYPELQKDWLLSCKLLLEYGAQPFEFQAESKSAAMIASRQRSQDVLLQMIAQAYNKKMQHGINNANKENESILTVALDAFGKELKTKHENSENYNKALSSLLQLGANVNQVDKKSSSVLMRAVHYGIKSVVETLLLCAIQSVDFSICNDESENALIFACRQPDPQLALLLLSYMPNNSSRKIIVSQMDNSGNTPLSLSSKMGCPALVEMLLSYGADPNNHSSCEMPLINAVKALCTTSIRHLISCNANIDVKDENGDAALHHAVRTEKVDIVKLLLEAGADVNAVNTFQQSPLHLAIHHSKKQINTSLRIEKALLEHGAHINAVDILGRTALHTVFVDLSFVPDMHYTRPIKERVISSQEIEAKKRKVDSIIAEFASKYGTKSTALWLSEGRELKVNNKIKLKKLDSGESTLTLASIEELRQYGKATWEDQESQSMGKSDRIDIFGFLLQQPALELNIRDSLGRTAMHYAASVGAFTCTSQLLDKGAEVNMQDNDQNIPVNVALKYNHVDYAVMISQRGANLRSDIYLADGTSKSIFEYSLSKDYINLGYFVVEKDASPQKYVYDALKTGKFHIASLLLNSASESTLKGLNDNKQTFFHLITAFKPFDHEIYEEYGNEFFDLLIRFGTAFDTLDSCGRSPLHWACKFNHASLARRLLSLKSIPLNIKDKEGKSELWYAVHAQNSEIIKLLIDHGATINSDSHEVPSAILVATMKRNLHLVKLLIENGASLQADDGQNRPNAVMQAVVDQNIDILEVLLKAGALPSMPSIFNEKIDGKERSTLIEPLLVACTKFSDRIFELLVEHNAYVNVLAPANFEPLYGQSPLMYSLSLNNFNRIKILFNHGADVNQVNMSLRRTIFYSFLLDKIDKHWLEPMWNQQPKVNIIDDITGQTLLEFAIRQNDQKLLERLLEHGGDVNVLSCRSSETAAQIYFDCVPALFHAVLNNNTMAVELILSHPMCKNKIDWKFRDEFGRNVISRCVQCFSSYSYQNEVLLRYLINASGHMAKALLDEKDKDGKRAIDYASNQTDMNLYNVLIECGSAHSMVSDDDVMDVDTEIEFQTMPVEEDSTQAREILLKKAEEEKLKKGEEVKEIKVEIDPNSELQDVGSIVSENGEPLDIMLHRTDVSASQYGLNMFYKMSLIYNKLLDMDILWTRWGAIGQTGAFQKTPIPGRAAAVAEFKKLFKSKSGNLWDNRKTDFTSKPGRFNMVKVSSYKDIPTLTELDLTKPTVPSQLSSSIQDFLKLCVNFKHLESAKHDVQMGLPLGQLSDEKLGEADRILSQVDQILYELEVLNTSIGGMHDVQRMKELYHKLALLSNDYYLLIPKSTDSTYGIRPLSTRDILRQEQGRLSNLKYFNYTANVLMAAQHRNDEMHPLDYVHKSLECNIQELSPKSGHEELYNAISKYMQETGAGPSGEHYDLLHLFSVDRKGEAASYEPFATNENRMLLWHGSKISNFIGILKQGLRIKPGQAYETGSMFGSGLYFADMFSKSSGYCNDYSSVDAQPYSLMLLCEVALGKTYDLVNAKDMDRNEEDHLSTKGLGQQGPDPKMFIKDQRGVKIPQGPVIPFEDTINNHVGSIGRTNYVGRYNTNLMHNEYIVYDPAQVRIKYLLVVQNNRYCPVCAGEQISNSMKRLQNYSFKADMYKHNMSICNEYESAVIEMQMYHQNTDTEEIYQESMKGDLSFLENSQYGASKITTAMELNNTSYVCNSCAQGIKDRILVKWFKESQVGIPSAITEREDCKWGFECTTQKHKLEHAKAYNHLCAKRSEK